MASTIPPEKSVDMPLVAKLFSVKLRSLAGLYCLSISLLGMSQLQAAEFLSIPLERKLFEFNYESLVMSDYTFTKGIYRQADASYLEPRRLEFELSFEYTKRFSLNLDLEYEYDDREFGFKDAYIDLDLPNRYRLKIGKQKQVFGISRTSSSKNLLTIERPVSTDLLQLDRTRGILFEKSFSDTMFQAGVFRREDDDGETIDSALVRGLFEPNVAADQYWHLGMSLATEDYAGVAYRLKSKGASDAMDNFLKTDKVNAEQVNYFGLDSAWRRGRFSVMAEFIQNRVSVIGEKDLHYNGGYLQSSWFLTGDKHRFRNGRIRGVQPSSQYALEFVTTYSVLDAYEVEKGFEIENLGVGLNYYHSGNIKLMAEFNLSRVKNGTLEGQSGRTFLLRLQLEF